MNQVLILKLPLKDQRVLEVALLKPFLNGTILFSSISPDYDKNLAEELFGCFKYIGIPINTLYKMPIRERKFYIARHNKAIEDEKNKTASDVTRTDMIDAFTDLSQQNGEK